jgi:release factor glutamine methyltransferase
MLTELYSGLLGELRSKLVLPPDQPDETVESTLQSLWHAAAGNPCSAKAASELKLEDLSETQISVLRRMIAERCAGKPLMLMTGRAHFMGLELEFTQGIFIVRPETEILGNTTVDILRGLSNPVLIDMGCGSGNLTCGISHALPGLTVHAVDILKVCVDQTTKNVARYNLTNRASIHLGDFFAPLESLKLENKIDAVISAPPYIAASRLKSDRAYLVEYEPREAFDGGPFGFAIQQRLIKESLRMLKPGGHMLFEFGAGQDKQVKGLINRAGGYDKIDFSTDTNGIPRVVIARKAG